MDALKLMAQDCIKEQKPELAIGSTVRVYVKIREGERERVQMFVISIIIAAAAVLVDQLINFAVVDKIALVFVPDIRHFVNVVTGHIQLYELLRILHDIVVSHCQHLPRSEAAPQEL